MLDKSSEVILKILLEMSQQRNSLEIDASYDELPKEYANFFEKIVKNLENHNLVTNFRDFLGGEFHIEIFPHAKDYFAEKQEAFKKEQEKQMAQNINITANGSNINFGSINNSTLSVENSITNIEKQIEEKGGNDKELLKEIFEEVKELCEKFQANALLPKRKNLMEKISSHMSKHGWFYGEVTSLIGSAVMKAMMG